ncbi:ABC transporter permease [Nonomuraea antimicrobica]|uniref:ABC transporter permease n=1 Tax=Nonomuraea antimicrobica TaxID=561173 RepID=A0ABP7E3S0_9ACTN
MGTQPPLMRTRLTRHARNLALELVLPLVLLVLWWFLSARSTSPYFPPLATILSQFQQTWLFAHFLSDAVPTLQHLAVGFCVAVVVGVAAGIVLGSLPLLAEAAAPVLEFVRSVPIAALLPAGLLLLGIGPAFQIAVIAFSATWPILLNTLDGVRGIDSTVLDFARSYRVPMLVRLFRITIPAAGPNIIAGMRVAVSLAVSVVIFSELIGATDGIGYQILQAQFSFAVADVWAGIILLGILGYLINIVFRGFELLALRQHRSMRKPS